MMTASTGARSSTAPGEAVTLGPEMSKTESGKASRMRRRRMTSSPRLPQAEGIKTISGGFRFK